MTEPFSSQTHDLLPDKFKLDAAGHVLYQESERSPYRKICNYLPILTEWKQVKISDEKVVDYITFFLQIDGVLTEKSWSIKLSSIERIDFTTTFDARCMNDPSCNKTRKLLVQIAHYQLRYLTRQLIPHFDELGWAKRDNEHVYVAGKQLITKDGFSNRDCDFGQSLSEFSLDVDEHMTEEEAATHWFDLMEIYPQVTDILVANCVVGLTRSLFNEAQTPPQYMIYMVSPPHKGKTTYCRMTSSVFSHSMISASSSYTSMQKEIWRFRDCPVIIDDLYCEKSKSSMNERESAVSKIIRILGNNEENKKQLGKTTVGFSPNSTAVLTAEYLLRNSYSSLSRCIILHLEHGLDKGKISPLQKNPLALSTAAYYFIRWCTQNYSDNVKLIKEEHDKFQEMSQCEPFGFERIKASAFVLETGIRLLCKYAMGIGILSERGANNTMHSINVSLTHIITHQINDMEDTGDVEHCHDLTYPVGYLLEQNRFKIAPSVREYRKDLHDGVLQENLICLESKKLVRMLRDCLHDLTINQEEIGHDLRGHGLLVMDKSDSSTKKTKNVRMFHIRKRELETLLRLENNPNDCPF